MTPTDFSEKLLGNIISNCSDKDLNEAIVALKDYKLKNSLRLQCDTLFKNHPFARSVIQLIEEENQYRNEQPSEDPTDLA
jgi:hypothetical protein